MNKIKEFFDFWQSTIISLLTFIFVLALTFHVTKISNSINKWSINESKAQSQIGEIYYDYFEKE